MAYRITKQKLDGFAPGEEKRFTLPVGRLSYDRLSLFIVPQGEAVTVDLILDLPLEDGSVEASLPMASGGSAGADEAFVFTTEDLYPGDLVVAIKAGQSPPSEVNLIAVAS